MKDLRTFDAFRVNDSLVAAWLRAGGYGADASMAGVFRLPLPGGHVAHVIATTAAGWDHVSVSLGDRCATWTEMEIIKHLFYEGNETAVQYHVPTADHVDLESNRLHLWRPRRCFLPRPPAELV